jgi:hypothetical protein
MDAFRRALSERGEREHRRIQRASEYDQVASDEELWEVYLWALRFKKNPVPRYQKLSPISIAAETIICQKLLGLDSGYAVEALSQIKHANDLGKVLQEMLSREVIEVAKPPFELHLVLPIVTALGLGASVVHAAALGRSWASGRGSTRLDT